MIKKNIILLIIALIHVDALSADKDRPSFKSLAGEAAIATTFAGLSIYLLNTSNVTVFIREINFVVPVLTPSNLGKIGAGVTCAGLATYSTWRVCQIAKSRYLDKPNND